ncbi:hypothetical protein DRE_00858 [Drechslerella stenobrocha 248]|uniref:F-box domain-containing protein n=1 Tax=Drechslerella stenobrocha 248 TaxID=1043628 RepID=W7HQQ9_9PEZI|nr:hypothetical protein DRE_00858 [Drechslerella stenobrocha 248]
MASAIHSTSTAFTAETKAASLSLRPPVNPSSGETAAPQAELWPTRPAHQQHESDNSCNTSAFPTTMDRYSHQAYLGPDFGQGLVPPSGNTLEPSQSYTDPMDIDHNAPVVYQLFFGDGSQLGTADQPIIVDESEAEDASEPEAHRQGTFNWTPSLPSRCSSRELSIFNTPPHSAISATATDSLIPNPLHDVIDLTGDDTVSPLYKGKERAVSPPAAEVPDISGLLALDSRCSDDNTDFIDMTTISNNRSGHSAAEISDEDSTAAEIWESLEHMMETERARDRIQALNWEAVVQTCPVSKLPTEILTMIFKHTLNFCYSSKQVDPTSQLFSFKLKEATPLMRVCRRWRYTLLPTVLRDITISECTFLTKSAHCPHCVQNKHLVSVPIVRSLFDGTATPEVRRLADHIRTVALSPLPCTRRHHDGEDSLESGFVFFLPNVETVILPSDLTKAFLNGASVHGLDLDLKSLPAIKIYNTSPYSQGRRRVGVRDPSDLAEVTSKWVIPQDIKKLEVDGGSLQMCTSLPMLLLEELSINQRLYQDKFVQPAPSVSTLCQFLSYYTTNFTVLSRITMRGLLKQDPGPYFEPNGISGSCICSLLASIPSLEHLDVLAVCPLFFTEKVQKCIKSVSWGDSCNKNRSHSHVPTKLHNLQALISSATDMRARLIPEDTDRSRVPTLLTWATVTSREEPWLADKSLTAQPTYSFDLAKNSVQVLEYSSKAATRYQRYITGIVERSVVAISAREDKKLLSEYAIAARAKYLTDSWKSSWTGPPVAKKQRTTVLTWNYEVDIDVFLAGASAGEFMVIGRQKDRLLNTREAEERKARKAEMEKLKSEAAPKKRSRKRKSDVVADKSAIGAQTVAADDTTLPPIEENKRKKRKSNSSTITLPPIASLLVLASGNASKP